MSKVKKICFTMLIATLSLSGSDIETIAKTEGILSQEVLSHFKELFELHSFIETGTYAGDTTAEASKIFNEVHSIEIWRLGCINFRGCSDFLSLFTLILSRFFVRKLQFH